MIRDRATAEENHSRFIKRSIDHESVWGLKGPNGYGWCESNEYDDRDVLTFWSDRAYAKRARKSEFPEYELSEITKAPVQEEIVNLVVSCFWK